MNPKPHHAHGGKASAEAPAPPFLVAVPLTAEDEFSPHFGGATQAALFTVDLGLRRIVAAATVFPPTPEPCGWADWLGSRGVRVLLAGGIGWGARQRMAAAGIEVVAGVSGDLPALLVQAWVNHTLLTGPNGCEQSQHAPRPAADAIAGADCCCTRDAGGRRG